MFSRGVKAFHEDWVQVSYSPSVPAALRTNKWPPNELTSLLTESFPFISISECGFGLVIAVPGWVQSHLPGAGIPRAAWPQMVLLAGQGQALTYMLAINGFLNGRKWYCYLFGSNVAALCVERKNVPDVFGFLIIIIIIITQHLLLKVDVAFKRLQTANNLDFPLHPPPEICLLLMTFSSIKPKNNMPY